MEDLKSRFRRKPIQELRSTLATLRHAGTTRLKQVRRWRRWFVRGAIIGATWAVLAAPQPGAETRAAVGRLVRPLAEIGTFLLTWLRNQQHASLAQLAARRAHPTAGNTTQGWTQTQRLEDMSEVAAEREDVERERSRPGT